MKVSLIIIKEYDHNISKIFQNLDQNKVNGHDVISIEMFNICESPVSNPLQLIFNSVATPKFTIITALLL